LTLEVRAMDIREGTGNVFADLGLPNPEERQAKALVAIYIEKLVSDCRWTQDEAAKRMGISQPDVSNIVRGRLRGFTLDRLFECLTALDQDVEIRIGPSEHPPARVRVACG
jgi:predicted XRE-type DNA-binding protein